MKSIQQRLSIGLASVLILVGLLLAQTSLWLFDAGLRRNLGSELQLDADNLLAALMRTGDGITLNQARLSPVYQRPFSGRYFRIEFLPLDDLANADLRSRSAWDHVLPLPDQAGLQADLADGPQTQKLLVYRANYRRFGQDLAIIVARDYTPVLQSFQQLRWIGLGAGVIALVIILLLQRLIVRRALQPLDVVRRQVKQLQQGQRTELDNQVPEELAPLVQQINRLLQHTEDTLKRSRNALGNVGHALKTPLAVLFSINARTELQAHPDIVDSMRTQLNNIRQRLTRELSRARLAGDVLPGAHFHCAEELPLLFATLQQIHGRDLQLHWQTVPDDLRLPWDREDLLELLGNLLDNACKWATARVALHIEKTASNITLTVDDDGPGIAGEQRAEVLSRGTRLDEQVSGHGLGLGIVRDIVDHLAGELTLADSPLGGLRVVISLPAPT
ncbi:ATP-binding protein [Cellvibrio sp. ARAG 10.3]|uniref:ATP-binding protein n=1 Tax=Cellvibrio sp. ARAG 10.3 TaxID=3451358 RepID=UPI003F466CBE